MQKGLRHNRILKKAITILCVFVMVFCFLPMNVFAQEIREQIQENEALQGLTTESIEEYVMQEDQEYDYTTKRVLKEETEKRTTNEKHYILEDGTRVVAMYPSNIHYTENGKLVDVDNTLEEKEDTKETFKLTEEELREDTEEVAIEEESTTTENGLVEATEGINEENEIEYNVEEQRTEIYDEIAQQEETKIYENKANSYKTKFTNKTKGYQLGSLTSEGYTITWRLKNAKNSKVTVQNPEENTKIEEDTTIEDIQINQVTSMIEYQNILSNIDINYVLAPEIIKENIVLNDEKAINNKIVFEYDTNGLEMKLLDNNNIIVYEDEEDNIKFVIEAPFMYDGKLEFTDQIELSLKKKKDKYELTLIPDKEWLKAEERVYPVTIDPTIQTSLYVESINDTFIYEGDSNSSTRYQAHILRVGNGCGSNGESTRSLIKFTLPTLNSGDQVIAAELSVHRYPNTDEWTPPTNERIIDVHKITSSWDSSANWTGMSSKYDTKVVDYCKYQHDKSTTIVDYRFDITTIVKDWYTTGNNYGVMLKEHEEAATDDTSDMYFFSSDTSGTYTNYRPQVIIAYRNQTGLEDYLSYHTQSVGRAGTLYTNDYNGNLTLIHTDASTPGNRLPVTIEHIYNTNEKDADIGYGKGIRLNLSQTLEKMTISSLEYLKYTDEDATAHYLLKNTTTEKYEDEDGLGIVAEISDTNVIMTDKSGNTMTFAKYSSGDKWHLKELKDTKNNTITLTLTTSDSNYLISKVTDAAGDSLTLTYSSGKLQKITDVAGRNTTYTYDSSSRLTTITYSDSKTSTYTYGSKNELTKVKNIDNSYISYTYYSGPVYRVKSITEYGTDGSKGNSLTITYGNNLTTFTDNEGYSNTYAFDNYGHCISIADFGKEAENIGNAYGKAYTYGTSGNTNNKLTLESKLVSVKDVENNLVQNSTFDDGINNWVKNANCTSEDKVVNLNGNNVLKFVGEANKNKDVQQNIIVSGEKGDIISLYAWVKSSGVRNGGLHVRSARIAIGIVKTDGTIQYSNNPINNGTDSWQFMSTQIIANGDYQKIIIGLVFNGNANDIYFDNIGIYKEEFGESYQYDSNGNLITSQDLAKQNTEFQYSGNNELLKNINPKGGKYVYEYDYQRRGRLLNALDIQGTKYTLDYDDYGNTTSIKVEEREKPDEVVNGETYYIKTLNNDKYIDVQNYATEDDGIVMQWFLLQGNNQKFTFTQIENDSEYYKIAPCHVEGKVLYYDETDTTNKLKQKTYEDSDEFKWKLIQNENGSYRMENKALPGYAVTFENDSTNITFEKWENGLNQCIELYGIEKAEERSDLDMLESNEIYYIRSKTNGLYLELTSDTDNASIIQSEFEEKNTNQMWRLVRESKYFYRIIPLSSKNGKALYPLDGTSAENQPVSIKTYTGATSQIWQITKNQNNTYCIRLNMGGTIRYIRPLDNSTEEGAQIVINSSADQYYLEKANMVDTFEEGATYTIQVENSKLYFGVNGTNVEQQEYVDADTQKWILHKEGSGYYSFRLASDPTKTMDLLNGSTANRSNIQVKTIDGNDSEKFEIIPKENGTYLIKPKNGKGTTCVDVEYAYTTPGTNISNYAMNDSTSQHFYIEKVSSPSTDKYIESTATYTSEGNYTTEVKDQLGNSITYEYNETKGTVSKTTDANGNETNYTYDSLDRLSQVSATNGTKTYQNTYTYENDKLTQITHNNFIYSLVYDLYGNQKQVKVGNSILITNTYGANNGNLLSSLYGNNHQISYTYDRFDRLLTKTGTVGTYTYSYDGRSNLKSIVDSINSNTTTYTYDLANRLVKEENTNGYNAEYEYDKNSNVSKVTDSLESDTKTTEYNYDLNNNINNVKLYNNTLFMYHYDRLLRTVNKEIQTESGQTYSTEFTYTDIANSNKTTTQIKSMQNGQDEALNYTYDNNGNILTISEGTELKHKYYYDALNQLIREDDKDRNLSITYEYDEGGNILNKKIYAYTTESTLPEEAVEIATYTYGNTEWKDQLTAYKNKTITYDAIGNPLTYDGNTYTWQNGRQLGGITNEDENLSITYKYNDSGIRTEKTVNGVTTTYYVSGSKVIYEKTGDNIIYYSYDESGNIIGLKYNSAQYYYKKNLQGDIIGILDSSLQEVVRYTYDSWGKVLTITDAQGNPITDESNIGHINPYRYRGYRYDSETGLYYLQSRYYNPEWGRFINFDNYGGQVGDLLSHNGYAYCMNNPANMKDDSGNFSLLATLGTIFATETIKTAVTATVGFAAGILGGAAIADDINNVKDKIEEKKNAKSHTVYQLRNNTNQEIEYVGRTVDLPSRERYHKQTKPNHTLEVIKSNLTQKEARGLEQIAIIQYSTKNALNKINGISPNNKNLGLYMRAAQDVARQYFKNTIHNEALYWMYEKWR